LHHLVFDLWVPKTHSREDHGSSAIFTASQDLIHKVLIHKVLNHVTSIGLVFFGLVMLLHGFIR
jgi:hypothetical protein